MEEGLKWNLGGKLKVGENTLRLHLGNKHRCSGTPPKKRRRARSKIKFAITNTELPLVTIEKPDWLNDLEIEAVKKQSNKTMNIIIRCGDIRIKGSQRCKIVRQQPG